MYIIFGIYRVAYNEKSRTQKSSETDDERLKNIEPRMIEMIENEVKDWIYVYFSL